MGVANGMPFIHGSQGCATYIRRYMIGHYREPVDIPCSNFSEASTIFGGKENLENGLLNVIQQYNPQMIGICTTCLAETIGEDISMYISEFKNKYRDRNLPHLVEVSTPSYSGTHSDGFYKAVKAMVKTMASDAAKNDMINIFAGMLSPADIRYLKDITDDFGADVMLLPDYSDSLDGGLWEKYEKNIEYGTQPEKIVKAGGACASVEFSSTMLLENSSAGYLMEKFGTSMYELMMPIGIDATDKFFNLLSKLTKTEIPQKHIDERARLVDSYIDGHKYIFDKKAIVYGEEDFVVAMARFLTEIGIVPAVCASGGQSRKMSSAIQMAIPDIFESIKVIEDCDFIDIQSQAENANADIIIGNSNGYKLARKLNIPLVRVGMPIHDRIGAARTLHIGYRGTQQLYDRIVNAFIELKQNNSPVGYTHI